VPTFRIIEAFDVVEHVSLGFVARPTHSDLSAIIPTLGQSAKDLRDAAILLVGFAGAFRRLELVAMEYHQIEIGDHGARIQIARSKTDQEGRGRVVFIPRSQCSWPLTR
jgi:integrase